MPLPLNQIIHGNCISVLQTFPENSIDVIFADPPYNLQLKKELYRPDQSIVDGVHDKWDQFEDYEDYDTFTTEWLTECKRVLKPQGTIWVIGSYHNIFRIGTIMQNLKYWILNDIIWIKTNPTPNFRGMRFTNANETIIWAQKEKGAPYTFNHYAMKSLNDDLQMRSDWYLPVCRGNERLKINGNRVHSTQKPASLLYRIIMSSTFPDDIILDPFFGTGTTGSVAKQLKRNWIGIEANKDYIEIARKRIENISVNPDNTLFRINNPRREPRVPFGSLIENGYIKPGQKLFYKNSREKYAVIRSDGTLEYNGQIGSIHKIASMIDKSSNNGWIIWRYWDEQKQAYELIDELRINLRQELNNK